MVGEYTLVIPAEFNTRNNVPVYCVEIGGVLMRGRILRVARDITLISSIKRKAHGKNNHTSEGYRYKKPSPRFPANDLDII